MLPTLLVWRAQLRAARHHAASHPGERVQRELAASAYERLCAPVLEAVDDVGGPAVPAALAAVLGFVASTLARDGGA